MSTEFNFFAASGLDVWGRLVQLENARRATRSSQGPLERNEARGVDVPHGALIETCRHSLWQSGELLEPLLEGGDWLAYMYCCDRWHGWTGTKQGNVFVMGRYRDGELYVRSRRVYQYGRTHALYDQADPKQTLTRIDPIFRVLIV